MNSSWKKGMDCFFGASVMVWALIKLLILNYVNCYFKLNNEYKLFFSNKI